jgi:predicted Zn-dependent peptidase
MSISGTVVPGKSSKLFSFISEELTRMRQYGAREAELKRAKQYAIGNFQISHQTPQSLVNWYSRYFVENDYFDFTKRPEAIKSITKKELNDLVDRFFGDGSTWAVGALGRQPNEASTLLFERGSELWA